MLSPWFLAVLAVLLIALFIWLLLRERSAWLEAETLAKPAARVVQAPAVIPSTSAMQPAAAQPAEPAILLTEPVAPSPIDAIPVAAVSAEPAVPPLPPVVEERAVEMQVDNLQLIEGIGPKIAGLLQDAGVHTFAQLAALDPARILEILHAGGIRLADPRTWPEQARLAAAGDTAALQALQDRLKGGREAV